MVEVTAYGRISSMRRLRHGKDGKHLYINFLLASHQSKTETLFIPCISFDGLAATLDQYLTVGDRVVVHGRLMKDKYGKSPYSFKLKVLSYQFVETLADHEKHFNKHLMRIMKGENGNGS